jgi:hypothetical protein
MRLSSPAARREEEPQVTHSPCSAAHGGRCSSPFGRIASVTPKNTVIGAQKDQRPSASGLAQRQIIVRWDATRSLHDAERIPGCDIREIRLVCRFRRLLPVLARASYARLGIVLLGVRNRTEGGA